MKIHGFNRFVIYFFIVCLIGVGQAAADKFRAQQCLRDQADCGFVVVSASSSNILTLAPDAGKRFVWGVGMNSEEVVAVDDADVACGQDLSQTDFPAGKAGSPCHVLDSFQIPAGHCYALSAKTKFGQPFLNFYHAVDDSGDAAAEQALSRCNAKKSSQMHCVSECDGDEKVEAPVEECLPVVVQCWESKSKGDEQ